MTHGGTTSAAPDQGQVTAVRRGGGLRRLPSLLPALLESSARRRGLADGSLLTEWATIVGEDLARHSVPIKVSRRSGGTLEIRVSGAMALQLMHEQPLIVERINRHFGFEAVRRLRLIQAPVANPGGLPLAPPQQPDAATRQRIEALVEAIQHDGLKDALARLGFSLDQRPRGGGTPS